MIPPEKIEPRSVDHCVYRLGAQNGGSAICAFVQRITDLDDELCRVPRDACEACCRAPMPSQDQWNPVVASLVHNAASIVFQSGGAESSQIQRVEQLSAQATRHLRMVSAGPAARIVPARATESCCHLGPEIERVSREAGGDQELLFQCLHPRHEDTTPSGCRLCHDWSASPSWDRLPLPELVPPAQQRCAPQVHQWAVGVTTAPRAERTLAWCLDSLARAGWQDPHLFVDSSDPHPEDCSSLQRTWRHSRVGAWPNYYLALCELLLRQPHADAFMVAQDDAFFYDRENVREYLEHIMWPGPALGLVSLYSSKAYTAATEGWHVHPGSWRWGALAFIFPRELACRFVNDARVFRHRWASGEAGVSRIDSVIGSWARSHGIRIWHPTPSLVQHVGNTSSLWLDSPNVADRRADYFAGDVEVPFEAQATLSDFPEVRYSASPRRLNDYRQHVARGRERMQELSVVICGLARDVRSCLPRTVARIEKLGTMFKKYRVVLFENDSADGTREYLGQWADKNQCVHLLSQTLASPRFPQTRSLVRAATLASYRNRYREYALQNFGDFDCLIVVDTDLREGWSYDGLSNTFGHDDWDFVGSYGIASRMDTHTCENAAVHFDAWAFRKLGQQRPHAAAEINHMHFRRGDALMPVSSCFGGLGVYRMSCMHAAAYGGDDCEHVVLHRGMWRAGFRRLFLNPSQIVLY